MAEPFSSPEPAVQGDDSTSAVEPRATGFRTFLVIWAGQLVSLLGSGLTAFALGVWVYQRSGSVTQFALISLFATLPGIALSPLAGALVDRWDRRWAMMASDSGAALATLAIAALIYFDALETWLLYLALAVSSTFGAIQWPAFTAASTVLVPKDDLTRAAGLRNFAQSGAMLMAPMLGGVLLVAIGIHGVILVDVGTFFFAVGTLLLVRIPRAAASAEGESSGSLGHDAVVGWTYMRSRVGLFGLLIVGTVSNLALGLVQVLAPPMALAFASASATGVAMTVAAAGMVAGSVLMGVWRGPRLKINGVLGAMVACGLCIMVAGLRPSIVLFTVAGFLFFFGYAISGACGMAIWQMKVPADLQGRVFAVLRMFGWSTLPLAYLLAGPLADRVFEPLLSPSGGLAGSVGRLFGVGDGRGTAVLLSASGLLLLLVTLSGYLLPRVRRVEAELPNRV